MLQDALRGVRVKDMHMVFLVRYFQAYLPVFVQILELGTVNVIVMLYVLVLFLTNIHRGIGTPVMQMVLWGIIARGVNIVGARPVGGLHQLKWHLRPDHTAAMVRVWHRLMSVFVVQKTIMAQLILPGQKAAGQHIITITAADVPGVLL